MAKTLPIHLSHKSALALIPPPSITAPIEAIRRIHDKQCKRWPPHINLLYPFLSSPSQASLGEVPAPRIKEGVQARIEKAVRDIKPFRVSLNADAPGIFSHGRKSKTIWLGPSTEAVQQLQAALQAEFPECVADKRPFVPHLSVGQARSNDEACLLTKEVKKSVSDYLSIDNGDVPAVLEWDIDQVFVIEREGFEGRFEIIGTIKLGDEKEVQPLSIQEEAPAAAV